MDWRNLESFPPSSGGWIARTSLGGRDVNGKKGVGKILLRWNPYTMVLVSVPGNAQLLPALEMPETRYLAHSAFIKRTRISLAILFFSFLTILLIAALRHTSKAYQSLELLVGIGLFSFGDYLLVMLHPDAIAERALFAYHVRSRGKIDAILWTLFMLFVGVLQYVGASKIGSDEIIIAYGAYFPSLGPSGIWRLLTGPLLHVNALHWFSNLVMLIVVGIISGAISRANTVALFLVGSVVGALASLLLAPYTHFDTYVGISAGVTAMLGFCIGTSWRRPKDFPQKFAITLMAFAVMDTYLAWICTPNASNEGHIAGLIFGLMWGYRTAFNNKASCNCLR